MSREGKTGKSEKTFAPGINQETERLGAGCQSCHPLLKWAEPPPAPKALKGRESGCWSHARGRAGAPGAAARGGMALNSCGAGSPRPPRHPGLSSLHLDVAEGSLKITLPAVSRGIRGAGLRGATLKTARSARGESGAPALRRGEGAACTPLRCPAGGRCSLCRNTLALAFAQQAKGLPQPYRCPGGCTLG